MKKTKVTKLRYGERTMGRRFSGIVEVHIPGDTESPLIRDVTKYIRTSVLARANPRAKHPLMVMRVYHVDGKLPKEL